jgi:hypothetical protein
MTDNKSLPGEGGSTQEDRGGMTMDAEHNAGPLNVLSFGPSKPFDYRYCITCQVWLHVGNVDKHPFHQVHLASQVAWCEACGRYVTIGGPYPSAWKEGGWPASGHKLIHDSDDPRVIRRRSG